MKIIGKINENNATLMSWGMMSPNSDEPCREWTVSQWRMWRPITLDSGDSQSSITDDNTWMWLQVPFPSIWFCQWNAIAWCKIILHHAFALKKYSFWTASSTEYSRVITVKENMLALQCIHITSTDILHMLSALWKANTWDPQILGNPTIGSGKELSKNTTNIHKGM